MSDIGLLHSAVASSNREQLQRYLSQTKNLVEHDLNAALYTCLKNYRVDDHSQDCLLLLLRYKANANCQLNKERDTPLVLACRNADLSAVRILVQNGAKPDLLDGEGRHLLQVVLNSRREQYDVAAYLISVLPNIQHVEVCRMNCLLFSVEREFARIYQKMVEKGACYVYAHEETILHAIMKKKFRTLGKKKEFLKHTKEVATRLLLTSIRDKNGKTPIQYENEDEIKTYYNELFKQKPKEPKQSKQSKQPPRRRDSEPKKKEQEEEDEEEDDDEEEEDKTKIVEAIEEEEEERKDEKKKPKPMFPSPPNNITKKRILSKTTVAQKVERGRKGERVENKESKRKQTKAMKSIGSKKDEQKKEESKAISVKSEKSSKQSNETKPVAVHAADQTMLEQNWKDRLAKIEAAQQEEENEYSQEQPTVKGIFQGDKPGDELEDKPGNKSGDKPGDKPGDKLEERLSVQMEGVALHIMQKHLDLLETIERIRLCLAKHIEQCIASEAHSQSTEERHIELVIFGSRATGLAVQGSDIDMLVRSGMDATHLMALLEATAIECVGIQQIKFLKNTSMPIIKVQMGSEYLRLKVDITFESRIHSGVKSTQLVLQFLHVEPLLQSLLLVLKQLVYRYGLGDTYTGGLGSYSLALMTIALLQSTQIPKTRQNLGKLLLAFLMFYGFELDYVCQAVIIHPPGFDYKPVYSIYQLPNTQDTTLKLVICDPINPVNNVGRATYRVECVKKLFKVLYLRLVTQQATLAHLLEGGFEKLIQTADVLNSNLSWYTA